MRPALIIFSRDPVYGNVKTRLGDTEGPAAALRIYRELVYTCMQECLSLQDRADLFVFRTGSEAAGHPWHAPQWKVREQAVHGDLGERMQMAFLEVFREGYQHAMMIGTDCPYLDAQRIYNALDLLHRHPVVIGPAIDGGLYLIGLRAGEGLVFEGIRWGGAHARSDYLERLRSKTGYAHLLETLEDIDDTDSYIRYTDHLRSNTWCSKVYNRGISFYKQSHN